MPKVAIIGGGAAGMACAIAAAREGAEAHVYERADRVGKKLLVTGNGRCNMSNTDIMSSDYNDPEFVQEAMNALPPESVMAFFEDLGVLAFEEDEGRIYPYSNKAATVLDMLRLGMKEAGVVEHCDREVRAVAPLSRGGWAVAFADDAVEGFDAVVCAVGGNPSRALLPSDIAFHACTPVLAALKTDTTNIKALSGIRVRARVYLDEEPEDLRDAWLDVVDPEFEASYQGPEERGEVLFRDWGISGIAVFDMSRYVEPGQMVFLDLLPDMEPQDKVDFIWEQSMAHPSRTAAEVMSGLLPSRVARAVVVAGGLNPDEPIIAEQEAVVWPWFLSRSGFPCAALPTRSRRRLRAAVSRRNVSTRIPLNVASMPAFSRAARRLTLMVAAAATTCIGLGRAACLRALPRPMSKMPPRVLSRGFR